MTNWRCPCKCCDSEQCGCHQLSDDHEEESKFCDKCRILFADVQEYDLHLRNPWVCGQLKNKK